MPVCTPVSGCRRCFPVAMLLVLLTAGSAKSDEVAAVQKMLSEGRLSQAATELQASLAENPEDQNVRFSLGVVQFLQAVEGLGRDHYRYGLLADRRRQITFMRLPIPENPHPEQISYPKAREILIHYVEGLSKAEKTLAQVKLTGVKLPLQVGQIRLDLDGDGRAADQETFWRIMQGLQPTRPANQGEAVSPLTIAFDDADVVWLRGYCHIMSGLAEIFLAHDWRDQFERTAHLFYPDVETPYGFLAEEGIGVIGGFNVQNALDVIALIHTMSYDVTEPARMQAALTHFETVIRLSRQSFALIEAEQDDDREWIPNAKQTSVMGSLRVGQGMIKGWAAFLDEMELILQGKKLLPFWRGIRGGVPLFFNSVEQLPMHPELGINVRKMFTEPRKFDAVLWLQGTGVAPYLEKGERIDLRTWRSFIDEFDGQFVAFMFWFN